MTMRRVHTFTLIMRVVGVRESNQNLSLSTRIWKTQWMRNHCDLDLLLKRKRKARKIQKFEREREKEEREKEER